MVVLSLSSVFGAPKSEGIVSPPVAGPVAGVLVPDAGFDDLKRPPPAGGAEASAGFEPPKREGRAGVDEEDGAIVDDPPPRLPKTKDIFISLQLQTT